MGFIEKNKPLNTTDCITLNYLRKRYRNYIDQIKRFTKTFYIL